MILIEVLRPSYVAPTINPLFEQPLSELLNIAPILAWSRHSPYSYYLCRASLTRVVGTLINIFGYKTSWVDNRTSLIFPTKFGCFNCYPIAVTDSRPQRFSDLSLSLH